MKYFHGSKNKFSEFSRLGQGKHGEGFYFTPDYNEARYFADSLSGSGSDEGRFVYIVSLKINNPFNSMNPIHCEQVCSFFNIKYKTPRTVGGAKEHYHHLADQLKKAGLGSETNLLISQAGFDAIFYDLMEHMIVFNSSQIEILEQRELD